MAFVRIGEILLHYRVSGRAGAPALVLVNSLGTDARIWDDVIINLGRDYLVVSYDKRGHGLSDAPATDYSLQDHLADLSGLLDHLKLERVALAGVSVGGLIAQGLALQLPNRVSALIAMDTAPRLGDVASWNARIDAIREGGLSSIVDAVMERWFSPRFFRDKPDALAGWRNLFLRTDPLGYIGTCATLRDTDLSASVGAITCPTLVAGGTEDRSTPPEIVKACAAAIPGAQYHAIAGAGHIPSIEKPAELAALMTGFLKEAGHG